MAGGRRGKPAGERREPGSGRSSSGNKRKPARKGPGFVGRVTRGLVLGALRVGWAIGFRIGLVAGLVLAGATFYFYTQLPSSDALFDGRGGGSVTMLDRNGNVFAWRGEQYGGDLKAGQVSPHLVHAIVATEDKRFWDHFGLDPVGIARAIVANLRAGRLVQGGSTLTQQTAKNTFLTAERSLERKLKEVPMSLALELKYTKEEILSIYLNRVYLGAGTYGFEAASQRYFGKSARLLVPAEAAMLAGLLRAPSRYAPTANLAAAQGRANVIIRLMEEQGYLTDTQVVQALANPAVLSQAAAARAGGYFADWVMEQAPAFLSSETTEDVTIATTFDPAIQKAAEAAVAEVFATKVKEGSVAQAAVVVMTRDGAVRAMVGGREAGVGQFNRASQALRQPGSAFKPVVYAAGLQAGMRPNDVFEDAPVRVEGWSPENYTRRFLGPVTLRQALAESINTVAVRVSERAGRDNVRALARDIGFSDGLAPGPAIALGTTETTLVQLLGVYATIANDGVQAPPHGIRSIRLRGEETPLLESGAGPRSRALEPWVARTLGQMMRSVVEEGTGRRARLPGREAAGKTGTTQNARDAWFVGYTADYVAGVWLGNDDNTPLTGVTGGGLPAEIWRETMLRVHEGLPPRPLPLPTGRGSGTPLASIDARGGVDELGRRRDAGRDGEGSVVSRLIGGLFGGSAETGRSGGGGSGSDDDFEPFMAGDR
ncbi:MAG: PBP1A family penicillin-binding protein [Pseudomonadota bacterium]